MTSLRLRGGSEATADDGLQAAEENAPTGFAAQLYAALKDNKSLDPNDHPSSLEWALAGQFRNLGLFTRTINILRLASEIAACGVLGRAENRCPCCLFS